MKNTGSNVRVFYLVTNNVKHMSGLEITILVIVCYVGVGFGVAIASGCEDEDHPVGKGCVWPLYLIVEATKAVSELIQEYKEDRDELKNSK